MKKDYKLKESFKTTRKNTSRIMHINNEELDLNPHIFGFSDCGYEFNGSGYFHERENGIGYMFTYTISGAAELIYENKKHLLHKGDLCMIDLNKKNVIKVLKSNHWEIYFLHIIGANIEEIFSVFKQNCGIIKHDFEPNNLINCVESLLKGCNKYDAAVYIYQTLMDALSQSATADYESLGINKAINFIYDYYKNDISIDDICSEIGLSKYHFIRKFKDLIGISPKQFILELRLKKASELLVTSKIALSEIAIKCGFKTTKNLYYSFEKVYGVGPKEYQKIKNEEKA